MAVSRQNIFQPQNPAQSSLIFKNINQTIGYNLLLAHESRAWLIRESSIGFGFLAIDFHGEIKESIPVVDVNSAKLTSLRFAYLYTDYEGKAVDGGIWRVIGEKEALQLAKNKHIDSFIASEAFKNQTYVSKFLESLAKIGFKTEEALTPKDVPELNLGSQSYQAFALFEQRYQEGLDEKVKRQGGP